MPLKLTYIFTFLLLVLATVNASAHYLWLETASAGKLNEAHTVRVFFGEYTYGVIEKPGEESFKAVEHLKVWVITPSGKKIKVETTPTADSYEGKFTPTEKGTYTVILNNDEIDVIDYTQYDFGIFKTHYHSTGRVVVGEEVSPSSAANPDGLAILDVSERSPSKDTEVALKVLYKGAPVKDAEVVIYVADLWSKKLNTDEAGLIKFNLPWATKYTVEVSTKEEVPGTFNGLDYEFILHCATYSITL